MLPEIEDEEDIEFLYHLQARTPLEIMFKKYGGKSNYYFKRDQKVKRYNITFRSRISYPALGLNSYFVTGRHQYTSPFLVQTITYYLPHIRYLSQFALPKKFEKQFLEQIVALDQEIEVYEGEELAPPYYNFNILSDKNPHERRLWRWMSLLEKGVFPDLPELKIEPYKIELNKLNILHYTIQKLPGTKIVEATGTERKTYDRIGKELESIYQEIVSVNSIGKVLFIVKHPLKTIDLLTLVKSFYQLFIYCYPYQVNKLYPSVDDVKNDTGILCIIMPTTPNIPLFHHTICDLADSHCFLSLIDTPIEYFELQKVYNQANGYWTWDKDNISLVK